MNAATSSPNVWWLAINTQTTSFEELRHRKVVAQGWPKLGDISSLCLFVPKHEREFKRVIQLFGEVECSTAYSEWAEDQRFDRTPSVLWRLLSLCKGDLVVGIEGTTVRGICEMPSCAKWTYRYQGAYDYAHTVGHPVEWVEWNSVLGAPPRPPNQSVHGLRQLQSEREAVLAAWTRYRS
jgi:hypothetical protein